MFNIGKCGHCGKMVGNKVLIENVDAQVGIMGTGGGYKAVSYCCIYCKSVLGVQMDPLAVKDDLKTELMDEFKKMLRGR